MDIKKLSAKEFISSLYIYNKERKRLTFFDLNPAQADLLDVLLAHDRVIVPKARQLGISTLIRAYFFWKAYCAEHPRPYAVMSHTRSSAEGLNKMDKTFYRNLPPKFRVPLAKLNTRTMVFQDSGASMDIYTAGGRGGTRSFAAAAAHLSEFAFYPNQEETLAEVEATVGDGQVIIESTANTPGDKFHQLILDAQEGKNEWVVAFYGWPMKPEYRKKPSNNYRLSSEERKMSNDHNLDLQQMFWRKKKLATLGLEKFRREFPLTVEESFLAATTFYFDLSILEGIEPIPLGARAHRPVEEPNPQEEYVLGCDVSAGVGGDFSAITILSLATREPVYHFESNTTTPSQLGDIIVSLVRKYNNPLVLVEANGYGSTTLNQIERTGYKKLWTNDRGRPFETRAHNRLRLFEHLRERIEAHSFSRLDSRLLDQLKNTIWDSVRERPDHPKNGNDDLLMSFALALWACKDIPYSLLSSMRANIIDQHKTRMRARRAQKAVPWKTSVPKRSRSPY
tara:strand:+ start:1414 stop:2940 length:1527 start_codon:yes stop_codon:yes gene_type:complete